MGRVTQLAILATLASLPLDAQRIEITPTIGMYAPLAEQLYMWRPVASSTGYFVDSLHAKVEPAVSMGIKVAARIGQFGLETSAITAAGKLRTARSSGVEQLDARTSMAAARVVFHMRFSSTVEGAFAVGPTFVWLAGQAYEHSGPSDRSVLGLTAAARAAILLSQRLHLEIGLADYVYQLDFGDPGPPPDILRSRLQHDLVTTLGVTIPLRP